MDVKLVGVHKVKAKLADGSTVTYYYAWRGGPRMLSKPGDKGNRFAREYARLTRDRPAKVRSGSFSALLDDFLKSGEYQGLRPSTRRDYERIISVIRANFGDMPVGAIEAKGSRTAFVSWRDTMKDTPRSADLHLTVLARVFSWAANLEKIGRNPLERVRKLHKGSRKDIIWQPGQLGRMLAEGPTHIANVVKMALWTMQRQADVLTMPTIAYADDRLWITQAKTGARVRIKPADEIMPILLDAKQTKRQRILVNSRGDNWTSSGFRASWRKALADLDIKGVTFHDLRGTAISYAYAMGADIERIAEISGHSREECEGVIRKNYLAGSDVIEAIRAGTGRE